jgi:cyclopropane fatty-acyl-phospholipid synthase-like methyltransferase
VTDTCTGFYTSYASYKRYETPSLSRKDIARFDAEIWKPAHCSPYESFLEIGSGTGTFLAYLAAKKVSRFTGIDHDPALSDIVPEVVRPHFSCRSVWDLLEDPESGPFDRVVLLDVLEHFPPEEGVRLLQALHPRLNEGARVVIKVPNASSPWGLQKQFGDLSHCTAFTPASLRQMAWAAEYDLAATWTPRLGPRRRMITDALVHRFLSWALLNPPPIWSANFYGMLEAR